VAVQLRAAMAAVDDGQAELARQRIAAAETTLHEVAPLFSLLATMQIEAFRTFRAYTEGASAIQSRSYKTVESLCRLPEQPRVDSIAYRSVPEVRERVLAGQGTFDGAFEAARAAGRLSAVQADELEEAMRGFAGILLQWRKTHYRLAVRMLGERTGTGYTEGPPYLESVQRIPVFQSIAMGGS
jgi:tryptophan 2,3-dioxygenase